MFVNTTLKEDHTTKFIQVNVQNKEAMLKVKNELFILKTLILL